MLKRTTIQDFDMVAELAIGFIKNQNGPVELNIIEDNFSEDNLPLPVGRVILQLLADRILYLTEDRKVMVSTQFNK